jgi:hypothetical protein
LRATLGRGHAGGQRRLAVVVGQALDHRDVAGAVGGEQLARVAAVGIVEHPAQRVGVHDDVERAQLHLGLLEVGHLLAGVEGLVVQDQIEGLRRRQADRLDRGAGGAGLEHPQLRRHLLAHLGLELGPVRRPQLLLERGAVGAHHERGQAHHLAGVGLHREPGRGHQARADPVGEVLARHAGVHGPEQQRALAARAGGLERDGRDRARGDVGSRRGVGLAPARQAGDEREQQERTGGAEHARRLAQCSLAVSLR